MTKFTAAALVAAVLTINASALAAPVQIDCSKVQAAIVVQVDTRIPKLLVTPGRVGVKGVMYRIPAPVANVGELLDWAARQVGVDRDLLTAVAWAESGFRHNTVSPAGAIGIMQLMPGTAQSLGVNPYDPWENVLGGAKYLKQLLTKYDGNLPLTLAAYNAGPKSVETHRGIPPYKETVAYITKVLTAKRGGERD